MKPPRHYLMWMVIIGTVLLSMGLAIAMTMPGDDPASASREAVTADLRNLADRAQQFYRRPVALGGGQGAWDGSNGGSALMMSHLTSKPCNINGTYTLTMAAAQSVYLDGCGTEIGTDGNLISVTIYVFPDSTFVVPNN